MDKITITITGISQGPQLSRVQNLLVSENLSFETQRETETITPGIIAKTYEKKPFKVQALKFKYTKEGIEAMEKFVGAYLGIIKKAKCLNTKGEAEILTLEDGEFLKVKHIATEGDYIIKGIKGEFYPCKPDIFEKSYLLIEK